MGHGYLNSHALERSHGVQRTYQTSSPQSSSSPASSPPSISPPGSSSSPISPPGQQQASTSTSTSGSSKQLVATFKLPKTCTSCGKAIKTQGKVCAKCKMRKYRERKKEQEHSLKVQMKTYREQEEALKARIRQLEEDLHRRGSSEIAASTSRRSHSFANDSSLSSAHLVEIKPDVGALDIERYSSSAHHEKVLAQQQEVLKQQQEIISIQQSVIAQQQHVINQHNLGHLVPSAATPLLHLRRPFLDHNSAAAVAALAALADDTKPPRQASAAMAFPPSQLQPSTSSSYSPHQRLLQRPSPQQPATLPPPVPELERTRRDATAPPASGSSSNRMAITHLLSPTTAEMCAVSCI